MTVLLAPTMLLCLMAFRLAAGEDARKHPGRTLCEAAQSRMATLEPQIDRFLQAVDDTDELFARVSSKLEAFLQKGGFVPVRSVFKDEPTKVVEMVLPDELRQRAISDSFKIKELERELFRRVGSNFASAARGISWSLEFDNSFLVNPSCLDFYRLNAETVRREFPRAERCLCNSFVVLADDALNSSGVSSALGVHSASNLWHDFGHFHKNKWFWVDEHRSFHAALTATDLDTSPFTVFEDYVPEQANTDFRFLSLWREASLPEETRRRLAYAYASYRRVDNFVNERVNFDVAAGPLHRYLETLYFLHRPDCASLRGAWWTLRPGQALYFTNWRAHSDNGLGTSKKPRVTLDLRCFGKTAKPFPLKTNLDLALTHPRLKRQLGVHEWRLDCLVALFNYTDARDFSTRVLGSDSVPLRYAGGFLPWAFHWGDSYDPLHDSHADSMREHYEERVRPVLDGRVTPNWDAFHTCLDAIADPEANPGDRVASFSSLGNKLRALGFAIRYMLVVHLGGFFSDGSLLRKAAGTATSGILLLSLVSRLVRR